MAERGRVLRDTNVGPGLVTVGGKQYTFTLEEMWRSEIPPRTGMFVEVSFNAGGAPEALYAVTEAQITKEQAQKALAGALRRGETMKGGILKRFGVKNALAMILLLISFFLLPNLHVGPGAGGMALSGWDGTGLNPATMMTNSWGVLSLLAIACLFAPLSIPFLEQVWARWLYAAPAAFTVVYFATLYHELNSQAQAASAAVGAVFGSDAARMAGRQNSEMISLAVGAYLVILCSLFLAWQVEGSIRLFGKATAVATLSVLLGHDQVLCAQATANPEYAAAKATAMENWINPPLAVSGVRDIVGVLTRDADELNAVHALYKTASPAVQGAIDGSMVGAAGALKVFASGIVTAHHCELTPLPATADPLTRAAAQVTDVSICLGGQPAETLGHKIANNGNVRALERQATLGFFGHGDKAAAIAKATDPRFAGSIDFAVQQVANNFSKNEIVAEIAQQRQASSQQPSTTTPASTPTVPSPAPPPQHPGSAVLDLPPAAPGYASMHASNPAQEGCWWTPFVSQKFGLEMAVSHCETNTWAVVAAESANGITLASAGSHSEPEQVLTVETKPADQTMQAAIKQQFIMKLKVPAARLSCRAQCESASDGMTTCKVIATGSYAKLKKFNQEDDSSEDPCPGLTTTDAVSTFFLARPSESKTTFLLFSADDLGGALNDATIHFLAQP